MNYAEYISSPDELDTPIMICNSSGLVVYKNYSAMRNIRLPRRNTHIQFHLDRGGLSEYENIPSRKKPSVISVDTGDRRANAFVMPYRRGIENCSLWVFFSMLQINALSRIFTEYERDLCDVGYEICDIIRCLDEKTFTLDEKVRADADKRIERRMEKILDYMFVGGDLRRGSIYSFENAISLLSEVTERSFEKIGYDVRFSANKDHNNKWAVNALDFRGFLMLYLYLTSFAVKLSRDRRVDISVDEGEADITLKIVFSLGYPQFTVKNGKDLADMISIAPKSALNLLIISRICENHSYGCVYDITEDDHDNVVINIKVPACKSVMVHAASDNRTEHMLLARDFQAAIYYLLLDTNEDLSNF
ncbi:MAG: hypothetical protein IKM18_04610 [Clostridia bacterium]|nr:hypothetical protein [Clostridia bacterium]